MKKTLLSGALLLAGALTVPAYLAAHGGTYRGPGDTVPPGASGGGGGGQPPNTPAPGNGGGSGNAPPTGKPGVVTPPGQGPTHGGGQTFTPNRALEVDLTQWQFWWGFNKEAYLNLKGAVHAAGTMTHGDDFVIGFGQKHRRRNIYKPTREQVAELIVPPLLRALDGETDNDIATGCMVALAKIGDARDEDGHSAIEAALVARLADPVQEIRETAAVSLGILADPGSIERLTRIVEDTDRARRELEKQGGIDDRMRAFAAYGLGLIGHRATDDETRAGIVRTLQSVVEEADYAAPDIEAACVIAMGLVPVEALERVDGAALPPGTDAGLSRADQLEWLLRVFGDDGPKGRSNLVRAHVPRAAALLLQGASSEQKHAVAAVLRKHVGKRASGNRFVRQSCVLALGMIGDNDAEAGDALIRKALIEATGSADQSTKAFSLIALAQVGGRMGEGERPEEGLAEVRTHLARQLAKGKTFLKPWAGLSIGVMERAVHDGGGSMSPASLRALRTAANECRTPASIGAYALGLGIARDLEAEEILREKLGSFADNSARGEVAIALGLMNSLDSAAEIEEVVRASKYRPELLRSAAIALGLLGDKPVVDYLIGALEQASSLSSQASISTALGFIGDVRSIEPLVKLLGSQDKTSHARAFAAVALGIVGDKEPLPWNAKIAENINYQANTRTLTDPGGTGILDIL